MHLLCSIHHGCIAPAMQLGVREVLAPLVAELIAEQQQLSSRQATM